MTSELRIDDNHLASEASFGVPAFPRFAIYFVPAQNLHFAGVWSGWLSNPMTLLGNLGLIALADSCRVDFEKLTQSPRRYGLHATLKAPFRLKQGIEYRQLLAATRSLAEQFEPFQIPALRLELVNESFFALGLTENSSELDRIAAAAVRELDWTRGALTVAERARRLQQPLTERQRVYLANWGYPHVFDDFRFHMTVTDDVSALDAQQRQCLFTLVRAIEMYCLQQSPSANSLVFDSLCILEQARADLAFVLRDRVPMGKPTRKL